MTRPESKSDSIEVYCVVICVRVYNSDGLENETRHIANAGFKLSFRLAQVIMCEVALSLSLVTAVFMSQ